MQHRTAQLLRRSTVLITAGALAGTALAAVSPSAGAAAPGCRSVRPQSDFYAAGRIASEMLTVPVSARCTTISVSAIIDPANPADHCATFLVGYFPAEGESEYTTPVEACSTGRDVVLATDVPDGMTYRVLYEIDYLGQSLRYKIRH
jgi:hypothetical protein